jgi:hypothetical protein
MFLFVPKSHWHCEKFFFALFMFVLLIIVVRAMFQWICFYELCEFSSLRKIFFSMNFSQSFFFIQISTSQFYLFLKIYFILFFMILLHQTRTNCSLPFPQFLFRTKIQQIKLWKFACKQTNKKVLLPYFQCMKINMYKIQIESAYSFTDGNNWERIWKKWKIIKIIRSVPYCMALLCRFCNGIIFYGKHKSISIAQEENIVRWEY